MRNLIVVAIAALFVTNTVFAASCADQATERKLAGAAKNSFMTRCEKDAAVAQVPTACETRATEKKLAGAARNSFIKKCESDSAVPGTVSCGRQAGDMKLAGAARNSFLKKCEADAKAKGKGKAAK